MDSFSDLDDCINTLEQLQLTLDIESATIKRDTRTKISPMSPRLIDIRPTYRYEVNLQNDDYDHRDFQDERIIEVSNAPVVNGSQLVQDEDQEYPKSLIEMLDFKSVSVRRPKLMSNQSAESDDLFPVPECADTTDFPPPPPPIQNVDTTENYLKALPASTFLHRERSSTENSSPILISDTLSQSSDPKSSISSLKLSPNIQGDRFNTLQRNTYNSNTSECSSQSNISSYTDREPKSINSFHGADTMSIREDPSKQTVVRFFTTDRTTKAIVVRDDMTVEHVIKALMEKHFWVPSLKSAVVEKVPNLKMERFFEEHERLFSCINSWSPTCSNMIFFEPREDIYGLFDNAKMYLGDKYSPGSINVDAIKALFISVTSEQFEYRDYLYIKKPCENSWKRKLCVLNHNGILLPQKKKSKCLLPSIVMSFNDRFHLYTSTGGWTKQWQAPTPFGFAFKPYNVIDPKSDEIIMFCAGDEVSMKRWCSNIRLCKYRNQILNNYQQMQNRSIYCSNLYSSNKQIGRLNSLSPTEFSKTSVHKFNNRSSLPTSSLHYNKLNSNK